MGPTQLPVQWVPGLSRGVKIGWGVTLLVPWSRKCRAIPLLTLWAVRPVQSLSACTRVHFILLYIFLSLEYDTDKLCSFSFLRRNKIFIEQGVMGTRTLV